MIVRVVWEAVDVSVWVVDASALDLGSVRYTRRKSDMMSSVSMTTSLIRYLLDLDDPLGLIRIKAI